MKFNFLKTQFFLLATLAVTSASTASAQTYQVTIKNLTQNQRFVGLHLSFHRALHHNFQTGLLLPESLVQLFYPSLLFGTPGQDGRINTINTSITPGKMMTFKFKAKRRQRLFSFFSPLHATDDGFVGVDSIELPKKRNQVVTVQAHAYDAGLFDNTESCELNTVLTLLSPPEECAPHEAVEVTLQPKNPVVIHNGIHGIGDLSPAKYDWKNPVAEISLQKISK